MDPWRCGYCDEIIGVYEPMIVLLPSGSRATSRAAEQDLTDVPEASFHHACFESTHDLASSESLSDEATSAAGS